MAKMCEFRSNNHPQLFMNDALNGHKALNYRKQLLRGKHRGPKTSGRSAGHSLLREDKAPLRRDPGLLGERSDRYTRTVMLEGKQAIISHYV